MIETADPVVVLGVGNVLLRDDGVGVRMIAELRQLALDDPEAVPGGTRLVDGGTLGLGLLDVIQTARSLLLLDAVNLGQEAGTVSVLRGDGIAAADGPGVGSATGGVEELLGVARLMGWLPDPVTLVGIQVGDTGSGTGLSPRVEAAVPAALQAARAELGAHHRRGAAGRQATPVTRDPEEATA